jgi:ankyrin repeat protein
MNTIENDLCCPISLHIFYHPVIASDGNTYEYQIIKKIIDTTKKSPLSFQPISDVLIYSRTIKNIIDIYLQHNPDKISDQYDKYTYDVNTNNNLNHTDLKFYKLSIVHQKIYFDNLSNLEYSTSTNWRPIHFVCKHSTPEMIKYIIDKGVDLECATSDNWQPIHLVCRYSTPEMIKYIIDKGVNLECTTGNNWRPIHFVCKHSTPEMIKYIIDKGVDLDCATGNNLRPIHLIRNYSTPEMIKYIIDKGVNLECTTDNN